MVVVDDLDERLDLAALALSGLAHAAGDLLWVALDSGNESMGKGVGLAAIVLRLNNDDLLAGITTARDDGLVEGKYVSRGCGFLGSRMIFASAQRTTRPILRTRILSVKSHMADRKYTYTSSLLCYRVSYGQSEVAACCEFVVQIRSGKPRR